MAGISFDPFGVLREIPESPLPPAMIASAISFRRGVVLRGEFLRGKPLRGELWTLAILLFFTVNPCARHRALRFTGWVSPIFFFPSAFERGGSSGSSSSSSSFSKARGPKRRET